MTKKREVKAIVKASNEVGCENLMVLTWDYEAEETAGEKKLLICHCGDG